MIAVGAVLGLSGCGSNSSEPTAKRESLSERLGGGTPMAYTQAEDGSWQPPQGGKRSSFEHDRESAYFKGNFDRKEFGGTKEIEKRGWWGKREVDRPTYGGSTDGSRFVRTAHWQGQAHDSTGRGAREATGRYSTSGYATGSARETQTAGIARSSDAETDFRRRVFRGPDVIPWSQARDLSVNDTKRLLGSD